MITLHPFSCSLRKPSFSKRENTSFGPSTVTSVRKHSKSKWKPAFKLGDVTSIRITKHFYTRDVYSLQGSSPCCAENLSYTHELPEINRVVLTTQSMKPASKQKSIRSSIVRYILILYILTFMSIVI